MSAAAAAVDRAVALVASTATSGVDVIDGWTAAESYGLAIRVAVMSDAVEIDYSDPAFGDQTETITIPCSLDASPADGTATPQSIRAEAVALLATLRRTISTRGAFAGINPPVTRAWLSRAALLTDDASSGFAAHIDFTITVEAVAPTN